MVTEWVSEKVTTREAIASKNPVYIFIFICPDKFCAQNNKVQINLGPRYWSQNYLTKQNLGTKIFYMKKFGSKIFESRNILGPRNFRIQEMLVHKILDPNN